MKIRAKKHLGQHFLTDKNISLKIVEVFVDLLGNMPALEVGPGKGILTEILLKKNIKLYAVEIDSECVALLEKKYPKLILHNANFLKMDFSAIFPKKIGIIGNFPYNISSQILFKMIENRQQIPLMLGMFQKEVAERIVAPPGNKTYGILSVITQAYYDIKYLFTVNEGVFTPPPKVKSAVVRFKRNKNKTLMCDEVLFHRVVKMSFNHRRKTLRNSLKEYSQKINTENKIWSLRPEQLSVDDFVELTSIIEAFWGNDKKSYY